MKWTTITSYVDLETGEEIPKKKIDSQEYVKIRNTTTHRLNGKDYGIKYLTWECERNRQQKLKI